MDSTPERLVIASGQTIYAQGSRADQAYLVLSGRVELRNSGGERPARHHSAGDVFGVLALVDDSLRPSTAVALTDCELLAFTSTHLSDPIQTVDPLVRVALGAIVAGYSETAGRTGDRNRHPSTSRIRPIWTVQSAAARDVLSVEHQLRGGLERGELDLYFQPIVRLSSGQLSGVEALIRWQHPTRGLLMPGDFIPLAERSGVIHDITTFCLKRVAQRFPALKAAAQGNARGVEKLFVSVNVSGMDLAQSAFAARTVSILCDAAIDPEDVRLEVTESILMSDAARCAQTLQNCRDQGLGIAIDDFGIGNSSLHTLNALPISVLKMDRSFCRSLLADDAGRKIIAAILHLGRELGLSIVAEGVETTLQRETLQDMGCDFGQGYLFGPAVGHDEALALVATWTPHRRDQRRARRVSPAA